MREHENEMDEQLVKALARMAYLANHPDPKQRKIIYHEIIDNQVHWKLKPFLEGEKIDERL